MPSPAPKKEKRAGSLQKLPPKLVQYTRELVALRTKTQHIVSFLGVPDLFVKEVYAALKAKAPQGLTRQISSKGIYSDTLHWYVALASDFQTLKDQGLGEIDAAMAALHRALSARKLFGGAGHLNATTWLDICRNLRCGVAALRRCRGCGSNVLLEDAREERYARLKCPWCDHDSGFVDFTRRRP